MITQLLRRVEGSKKNVQRFALKVKKSVGKRFERLHGVNKKNIQRFITTSMAIKIVGFAVVVAATSAASSVPSDNSVKLSKLQVGDNQIKPVVKEQKMADIKVENPVEPKVQPDQEKPVEQQPVQQQSAEQAPVQQQLVQEKPKATAANKRVAIARERASQNAVTKMTLSEKRALVKEVAAKYNIPWKILEAVWQVETGKSLDSGICSYAGACGPMQFMPATWRAYGVDGDGDGDKQITSVVDAMHGAARYLAESGANRGQVDKALYTYNHSWSYVAKVKQVANSIPD